MVVKMIDLRSDTVTLPTPEMRDAMYRADVGDDVFSEDPTVNALEARAAEMTGKQAAMLVPTGTMGNLICTTTHCRPGDEIILGQWSHIFQNEVGGVAALGGLLTQTLPDATGYMDPDAIEDGIRPASMHAPGAALLCIEQTHNRAGGAVIPLHVLARYRDIADRHRLKVHMDGARLFNAATALNVPVATVANYVDSLSFCLSKGLAAPVGSVVCGDADFIAKARRKRKIYGGGMRQAGVFAAAGLVALNRMVERLVEDHATAAQLAQGLSEMPGVKINPASVRTNIVICELDPAVCSAADLPGRLEHEGVLALHNGSNRVRFVTHHGISSGEIDRVLLALRQVLRSPSPLAVSGAQRSAY